VLNFPEGTTTRGELLNFHRGIFGLAALMNIPVIPLAISFEAPELCWVDDATLLGHYTSELAGKAHEVHIDVGPRQYVQGSESPAEFAARVRSWTVAALERRARAQSSAARSLDSTRCGDSPITSRI
jgi:lyso-ornithine lipid O-acyltransferase